MADVLFRLLSHHNFFLRTTISSLLFLFYHIVDLYFDSTLFVSVLRPSLLKSLSILPSSSWFPVLLRVGYKPGDALDLEHARDYVLPLFSGNSELCSQFPLCWSSDLVRVVSLFMRAGTHSSQLRGPPFACIRSSQSHRHSFTHLPTGPFFSGSQDVVHLTGMLSFQFLSLNFSSILLCFYNFISCDASLYLYKYIKIYNILLPFWNLKREKPGRYRQRDIRFVEITTGIPHQDNYGLR